MALLSFSRKLCLTRLISQVKVNCLQFHTLGKVDSRLITKTIPTKCITPKRNFFWVFKRRTKREVRLQDKPPEHYELIYRCSIDHYFLTFQHFGFYAAVIVCLVAVYRSNRFHELPPKRQEYLGEDRVVGKKMSDEENEVLSIIAAFLIVFGGLQFLIGKTPMRIYCYPQQQKYLLYFYGPVPNRIKHLPITAGKIKQRTGKGGILDLIPWNFETCEYTETGQRFMVFSDYFRYPADLYIMLGWQKDPDINYDYEEPKPKSEEKELKNK